MRPAISPCRHELYMCMPALGWRAFLSPVTPPPPFAPPPPLTGKNASCRQGREQGRSFPFRPGVVGGGGGEVAVGGTVGI